MLWKSLNCRRTLKGNHCNQMYSTQQQVTLVQELVQCKLTFAVQHPKTRLKLKQILTFVQIWQICLRLVSKFKTNAFFSYRSPPMTPTKVSQCVQSIWENEKLVFNEHLAMVFPGMYIIMT